MTKTGKTLLVLFCFASSLGSNSALADLIKITYSGEARTFGYSSSEFFHGSLIEGTMTYQSDATGTDGSALGVTKFPGSLIDFSFIITLSDSETLVSDELQFGRMEVHSVPTQERLDLVAQGLAQGVEFGGLDHVSYFSRFTDGTIIEPPSFLTSDALPSVPFSLGAELENASVSITWENTTTGYRQFFFSYLDSVTATVVSVPEPGTLALFSIGLLGMGMARRRKKA